MNFKIPVSALVLGFSFAGCTINARQPALHDLGIQPVNVKAVSTAPIEVEAPQWLGSTQIHYRLLFASPTQVRFYTLSRWIAPPTELLEQELESSGCNLGYPIKVRLLDFEQQFDSPTHAKALMCFSVEAFIPNRRSRLNTKTFCLEHVTDTPDADGAVNAFSELSRKAAEQIKIWISGLSKR